MGFPQSPQAHLFSCSEGLTAPRAAASRESLGGLTSHLAGLQGTRRKWGHPAQGLLSRWPSPGSVNDYPTAINTVGSEGQQTWTVPQLVGRVQEVPGRPSATQWQTLATHGLVSSQVSLA